MMKSDEDRDSDLDNGVRDADMPVAPGTASPRVAVRDGGADMMGEPHAEYLADTEVDARMDTLLRRLLTTCFRKEQDRVFYHRRYFIEPYPHRWIIRAGSGRPVAHLGMLERRVTSGGTRYPVGGICDVCVHPGYRRQGHAHRLMEAAHAWMRREGYLFALLFGRPEVYRSSGYEEAPNLRIEQDSGPSNPGEAAMIHRLADTTWPKGAVMLSGRKF